MTRCDCADLIYLHRRKDPRNGRFVKMLQITWLFLNLSQPPPEAEPLSEAEAAPEVQKVVKAFDLTTHLHRVMGTDLALVPGISTQMTQVLFTEVGPDLSRFPSVKQLCSW